MSAIIGLIKNSCLSKSKFFFRIYPFSNMLGKTNILSISELLSEMAIFWLKREFFSEFSRKCFKTAGKHNLAVCGLFWGEKQFVLIFFPFHWFVQKQLFKQIQIFLLVWPLSNLLRKTNFWVFLCSFLRCLIFD